MNILLLPVDPPPNPAHYFLVIQKALCLYKGKYCSWKFNTGPTEQQCPLQLLRLSAHWSDATLPEAALWAKEFRSWHTGDFTAAAVEEMIRLHDTRC